MAATADAHPREAARGEFAQRGFAAARLQDIAERAGLTHPTLLYHFGTKERLYAAVIEQAMQDWADDDLGAPCRPAPRGFDQVAALLDAALRVLRRPPRLRGHLCGARRSRAAAGWSAAIAEHMRPFLDRAVAFLSGEVEAGRLRPHDPVELMQLVYGAVIDVLLGRAASAPGCSARTRWPAERASCDALTAMLRARWRRVEPAGAERLAVDHRVRVAGRA